MVIKKIIDELFNMNNLIYTIIKIQSIKYYLI